MKPVLLAHFSTSLRTVALSVFALWLSGTVSLASCLAMGCGDGLLTSQNTWLPAFGARQSQLQAEAAAETNNGHSCCEDRSETAAPVTNPGLRETEAELANGNHYSCQCLLKIEKSTAGLKFHPDFQLFQVLDHNPPAAERFQLASRAVQFPPARSLLPIPERGPTHLLHCVFLI